jgi:hypothetical protein
MIVTFNKGSAPSKNHDTTACPHSWNATVFFSYKETKPFLSTPPITLSEDISKSSISTYPLLYLAAKMAA